MSFLGSLMGKVRCPACSRYDRHPRDVAREQSIRENNNSELSQMIRQHTNLMPKTTARAFVCMGCGQPFDLDTSLLWEKTSKSLGDERAAQEYRAIKDGD